MFQSLPICPSSRHASGTSHKRTRYQCSNLYRDAHPLATIVIGPEKLRVFAQRKSLPQILVDIAHDLRYLRNIGSHESEETILSEDIPAMLTGLEALVAYVYLLPFQQAALAERVAQRVSKKRSIPINDRL